MQRLILFRHAKAEAQSETGDDFDRRLEPRGVREAAAMGRLLAARALAPDVAMVSAARRTRETWAAVAERFPDARVVFEDDLYNADSNTIRRFATRAGAEASTVMMVGHNPGLHELTVRLMQEGSAASADLGRAARQFPTATAAVFLIDDNDRPVFDGLYLPERDA